VRLLSLEYGEGVGRVCCPENPCRDAPPGAATSVGTGGGHPRFLGGQNSINPFSPILKPTHKLKDTLGGGFAVRNSAQMQNKNKNVQGSDTLVVYSFFFGKNHQISKKKTATFPLNSLILCEICVG
jgi:hypothetical protein